MRVVPGAGGGVGMGVRAGASRAAGAGAGAGIAAASSGAGALAPSPAGSAWLALLRVSALFSVPGDLLAGAAAAGYGPGPRTLLAAGSSLCLYEAGMALNDWADRDTDAVERPERPLPSGRITPAAALGAAAGLTAAGLTLARAAGRPSLVTATALAATVWAYDLRLKNTPAGPLAMACARTLDVLQGAASAVPARRSGRGPGPGQGQGEGRGVGRALAKALPSAALVGTHTLAVTTVSRREAQGSSPALPLAAWGVMAVVSGVAGGAGTKAAVATARLADATPKAAAALYAGAVARPFFHAALNPSPYLLQRAVGSGIRALIPLQAALTARAGAPRTGAALLALMPAARRLSRKVSPT
ncbi:SCO3242 family prenyltransferase [Streptomyces sp. NPDC052496]|uniref:SCO3242 family prenyltransferase n=1 Tax=Streptomyces sp. NPDC052496 TaxID=3154951 RepID=UPI00342FF79A